MATSAKYPRTQRGFIVSPWRAEAAPIIARIIVENRDRSTDEVRALISAAYPFGPRQYHPYKIWLDEVKKQLIGTGTVIAKTPTPKDGKWVFGVPAHHQIKERL